MKLACPQCGNVHDIAPSERGDVVKCECGQAFMADLPDKAMVPRKESTEETPGGLTPDSKLASDSMVLKKFMAETGADPDKSHWIWRYWRGLLFTGILFLFYGFNFVFQTFIPNEITCAFVSLFALNFVAFGMRKAIREQSFAFWPGISIAVLTLFFLSWGSIHTSDVAASILFSTPILMFLVVKRIELILFGIGFFANLVLMAIGMEIFSPLIASHLLTALVWLVYRKGSASQTAGKSFTVEAKHQLANGSQPTHKEQPRDVPEFGQAGPEDMTAPLHQPKLVVVEGFEEGHILVLHQGRFTIGRGEGCNLRLTDGGVSRVHGSLLVTGDKIVYKDEGSHNGSLVNDRPVQSCNLSDQDLIMMGQTKIRFEQQ